MKSQLLILTVSVLTSLFSCNDVNEKASELAVNTIDSIKSETKKIPKHEDTVFIKHDKDWTSDNLNYVTDTLIFKSGMGRNILIGTSILSSSKNQFSAKWEYGLYFSKVTKTDCEKSAEQYLEEGGIIQNKINSIITSDSALIIDINIFDNCCYDFLCDISIVDGSTINLISNGYGTHCDCDCCYGLTYYLTKLKSPDYKKMKSVMINGDRKTMKKIN